jgi:hypothetical protein
MVAFSRLSPYHFCMEIKPDDELLDMRTAAARLGIARDTLRGQARKGVIKTMTLGGVFVTTSSEVERYRREHLGKVGRKPGSKRRKKPELTDTGA